MRKVCILFLPIVDASNLNAQSLNTREIVLRLDPGQFECSLLFTQEPDPRLLNRPHIKFLRLPARLQTIRLLREMLSGYDIIAYMDFSPASYLYLHSPRSLRKRTKAVMHVEGLTDLRGETGMLKLLHAGIAPNCDFYTGITPRSAQHFNSVVHREVLCVLPIGVDRKMFSMTGNIRPNPITVLFVGTLIERKGLLLLLDVAVHFPQVKFRLIGPGRNGFEQILRQRIAELKINNVTLEGKMPQEVIVRAMQESDIFLLPSRREGLPKVTLEAAASGLPCIVFRDYETPSVVDGITGFQVNTVDEMIKKLGLLIENAQLRESMGTAGRKLTEKFDWDTVAQLWQDAYLKIASANA
jgi:glycosyltransferase involved in cell wall biosynthesis